jgi:hypothetical protein
VAAAGLSVALIMGPGLAATADDHAGPPQHVLDKALDGVERGRERALDMLELAASRNPETGMPNHAQGNPGHATGLERAQEMVAKAAVERGYEKDFPGRGNAYGSGHAADVHAVLRGELSFLSPSELPSHGQRVASMVKAIEKFTDEKPGRGLGRDKKGDDGDE